MKRSFWEVGTWLQATAKNAEEAAERFESSCDRCNKAAMCDESRCPIYKVYQTRLIALEGEKSQKGKKESHFVHTRAYKKATPEVKTRKTILNYLTRLSKICTSRKKALILDDASVMVKLGEFTMAYWILKNGKLPKTAEKVMEIIRKYKEEN